MVAPLAAASSVAPFWTACQNWCWEPLDTMAMYGFAPPPLDAAGLLPPLLLQAATTMATAMAPATGPKNREDRMFSSIM